MNDSIVSDLIGLIDRGRKAAYISEALLNKADTMSMLLIKQLCEFIELIHEDSMSAEAKMALATIKTKAEEAQDTFNEWAAENSKKAAALEERLHGQ